MIVSRRRMAESFRPLFIRSTREGIRVNGKIKKTQKTWISFFVSLKNVKNMNFIFCKLEMPQKTWKNLKKHEFHFFASLKTSKTWISFFASLKKLKKHEFHFFASLKNSKNMNFIFCKFKKPQKNMNFIFCKLEKHQKTRRVSFFAS